jgi:aminoglycoside 2''-phosphotransferase
VTDKAEKYLKQIRGRYPALKVVTARLNEQGQSNDGLIINEEFIFRFPKHPRALRHLRVEFEILRALQGLTSLPIPNPVSSHLDTDVVGEAFFGYRLIPGEPFLREIFLSITESTVADRIVSQVATFLKGLHGLQPGVDFQFEPPLRDTREEWIALLDRIKTNLTPRLSAEDSLIVIDFFENFLSDGDNFNYHPVLRHGDFGTVNVLFDTENKRLSGVIDFGNAALGDPALDLAAIMAPSFGYGAAFVYELQRIYPIDERLLRRAHFYVRAFSLQQALYGLEHGNDDIFSDGFAEFSRQVNSRT